MLALLAWGDRHRAPGGPPMTLWSADRQLPQVRRRTDRRHRPHVHKERRSPGPGTALIAELLTTGSKGDGDALELTKWRTPAGSTASRTHCPAVRDGGGRELGAEDGSSLAACAADLQACSTPAEQAHGIYPAHIPTVIWDPVLDPARIQIESGSARVLLGLPYHSA
jgi:hypothetical protein